MIDIKKAKRVVIKVGTSTLTHENGKLNLRRIDILCRTLSDLKNSGHEIILVTSGAIGAGISKLGLPGRPGAMPEKQAAAAVGQCELMHNYDKMFLEYGHTVGQVLLTHDDVNMPVRRENMINTFEALLRLSAVPVVNENDTVAVEEIDAGGELGEEGQEYYFGENDTLSAIVAKLVGADVLILLSDIDGLYDDDPRENSGARLIPVVYELTDRIKAAAGGAGTKFGTGGMATKIMAAEIAGNAGIHTIIANGNDPSVLYDIFDGKQIGTVFLPVENGVKK
jgi:glutamate 5-kinase